MLPLRSTILASLLLIVPNVSHAWQSSGGLVGTSSTFTVDQKTEVPGATLKPGTYRLRIVDQLDDRMIVRVDRSAGAEHAVFLGVPHDGLSEAKTPGPLTWKSGIHGTPALRGFQYAGGSAVEFVYPKTEAVELAKLNAAKVVAVDPDSEGKPVLKDMSPDDLRLIHLWMLSLTTVTPNDKTPGIVAQKYQSEDARPTKSLARSNAAEHATTVANLERPNNLQPAKPVDQSKRQEHAVTKLPHTASQLPMIALCGLLSFLTAGGLRMIRGSVKSDA
jgi:hypothetical protein